MSNITPGFNDSLPFSISDCWKDSALNLNMQQAGLTFSLINMILTFLFATRVWKQWQANLPTVASFLWFVATLLSSVNRMYIMPDIFTSNTPSIAVDIISLGFDFASRISCSVFIVSRLNGLFPGSNVPKVLVVVIWLFISTGLGIALYGTWMQTASSRYVWILTYMSIDVSNALISSTLVFRLIIQKKMMLEKSEIMLFDFFRVLACIVVGDLIAIANCIVWGVGNDVYSAYYYGLYSARITLLEVFNSSQLNVTIDRVGESSTIEKR